MFFTTVNLAISNTDAKNEIPGDSATFQHRSSLDFRWDGTVQLLTHFRIETAGNAINGIVSPLTISLQLSLASTPTVALSAGGNDLGITITSQDWDSGWIPFATPLITAELLSVAIRSSGGSTVTDLSQWRVGVSLKDARGTRQLINSGLINRGLLNAGLVA